MALGFQLVLRPVLLTTAREGLRHAPFSQNFSPNTGTGCEAWIQASSELAELSIAKPCTGETPLQPWAYLWTSRRAWAGDGTGGQSSFSKSPNDCQNCMLAISWLSTPDRRQRGGNIATGHCRQQRSRPGRPTPVACSSFLPEQLCTCQGWSRANLAVSSGVVM